MQWHWMGELILGIGGLVAGLANDVGAIAVPAVPPTFPVQSTVEPAVEPAIEPAATVNPIRPPSTCPNTVDALIPSLLRDVPSYTNRVLHRSWQTYQTEIPPSYVLLAGRAELDPLSLGPGAYVPIPASEPGLHQVFFTTLERQYVGNRAVQLQHYHWLFLTQTNQRWRLALMASRFGGTADNNPPSPPQDTSQGAIAQAIHLWLRDCEAGDILLLEQEGVRQRR